MKLLKQICISLFISVIALLFINTISYASTGTALEPVNLRKEASTSSTILEIIPKDKQVEIIEEAGDWYKVTYNNMTGFLYKKYVQKAEVVQENTQVDNKDESDNKSEENSQTTKKEDNVEEQKTEFVVVDKKITTDCKIYITPVIYSSKINELKKDETVKVIQILNNWAYISKQNVSGWILKSNLGEEIKNNIPTEDPNNNGEITQEPEVTPNKIGYINYNGVNLRAQASTTAEVIKSLTLNTEVTIIEESGDWYKIKAGTLEGYVASRLVSNKKVEATTRSLDQERTEIKENITSKVEDTTNSKKDDITQANDTTQIDNSNTTNTASKGADVVATAKKYLKYKYVYGGETPSRGFDCSGFTKYVYSQYGISLSHSATTQSKVGTYVAKSDLKLGDLVIFNDDGNKSIGHVGIYIGNNSFIHASNPTDGVKITSLSTSYYSLRYVTARRVI